MRVFSDMGQKERMGGAGLYQRNLNGGQDATGRSTEGEPWRVEGGTKPAPQGLRQRHHGPWRSRHASTGEMAEGTGCSLRIIEKNKNKKKP
jgi:hypothetical protein